MSTDIEQRVVQMRFDNKQFEANVSTTMSTLSKLKQSLKLDGATKGMEDLSKSAKKVDLNPLSNAAQTVQAKFSAMEVMAVTALANITNSAVNAGKRIVSALTIDPIKTGFQEYETQINAVQTILANTSSKGTTLDDVNAALDELNTYADKTIYNFTEMTRNIGTFTAAGVDLDTSVQAIKGIANLAAVSGSTSQQASTAMYQLSQALASGTVKLMDWNSVVNAGMGGQVFQDALKETARLHGVAIDQMIKDEGSFRETLSKGWLTSEILTDTLAKFTGDLNESQLRTMGYTEDQIKGIMELGTMANDAATKVKTLTQLWDTTKEAAQSGWTQTWEIIVGDFEEAKALFTEISDFINKFLGESADARNNLLEAALGGTDSKWEQLVKQINDAGIATEDFQNGLIETAKKHGIAIDQMIEEEGSFIATLKKGWLTTDIIVETINKFVDGASGMSSATEDMTEKLEMFQKVVNEVWKGNFGNGEERIKALTEAGYDYAAVQKLVNKTVDGHKLTLEDLNEAQLKAVGYTDEEVKKLKELAAQAEKTGTPLNELITNLSRPSGRELLVDSLRNALHGLGQVIKAISGAWSDIFPANPEGLYNLIEGIHDLTAGLVMTDDMVEDLRSTFKGLFAIIDIIATLTGGALKFAFDAIGAVLKGLDADILSVTGGLGEQLVAIRDWIDEHNVVLIALEKLAAALKVGIPMIRGWIGEFMELPAVQNTLKSFSQTMSNAFEAIGDYFVGGWEAIKAFIGRIKEMDSISLSDAESIFDDFCQNVVGYFTDIDGLSDLLANAWEKLRTVAKDVFAAIKNYVETNFGWVGTAYEVVKEKTLQLVEFLKEKLTGIDIGALLTVGLGLGMIGFLRSMSNLMKAISNFSLTGLIGLDDVLNSMSKRLNAAAIKDIAIAIGILAASVALLTLVDHSKLLGAVGALGGVVVMVAAMAAVMAAISKIEDPKKSSLLLVSLSASVLVLVGAMKILEGIERDKVLSGLGVILTLATGMATIAAILGKSKIDKDLQTSSFAFISFSTSILILCGALAVLEKTDVSGGTIVKLIGIMGTMALLSAAMKNVKFGGGLSMIAAVGALKMLIGVIEDISKFDTDAISQNLEAFVVIFGMFSALMLTSHFAGKYAKGAGVAAILMSGALLIIIQAIKMIATVDPVALERALDAVTQILLIFGVVTALSSVAGENATKAGAMLLLMSGALLVLSGVIAVLALIKPDGLQRAVIAVTVLMGMFALLIAATKLAQDCKGTLIVMTVTLTLLVTALATLSLIKDQNAVITATACISALLGMFSLLIASTKFAKKANGTIILMTLVVGALAGILWALQGLPVETTKAVAASLSVLLLSLTASMVLLGATKAPSATALISMAAMALVLAELGYVLSLLNKWDVNPSIEIAESLSILILALSGACVLLSVVGTTGWGGVVGVGVLALLIAAIGGLIIGLNKIKEHIPSQSDLDLIVNFLETIGYVIGSFVGHIIAGLAEGALSCLPEIGTYLSDFMENAQGFVDGASAIKAGPLIAGVGAIVTAVGLLTAANFVTAIADIFSFGQTFDEFGEKLKTLGEDLVAFSDTVSGRIDQEAVTAAANAGLMLAEMAATLPATDGNGIRSWFFGEQDLSKFATQISAFGEAIVGYSQTVAGKIDVEAVQASANAGMMLAELAKNIPDTSGGGTFNRWFFGEHDLSKFAKQIFDFGRAIVSYSQVVDEGAVDAEAVKASASAGTMLSELANSLPDTSGGGTFNRWFFGEQDLSKFGRQIQAFGRAIVTYSQIVASNGAPNVNVAAVQASVDAAKMLSELANSLPDTSEGTFHQWFFGSQNLADFGAQLTDFGSAMVTYSKQMTLVDTDIVTGTVNVSEALVALAKALPEYKWYKDDSTLGEFGKQLVDFGEHLADFHAYIKDFNAYQVSMIVEAAQDMVYLLRNIGGIDSEDVEAFGEAIAALGEAVVDNFTTGFEEKFPDVTESATKMIDQILVTVENRYSDIQRSGRDVISGFVSGMEGQKVSVSTSADDISDGATTAINNNKQNFVQAGTNSIGGVVTGFANKSKDVTSTAGNVAENAADTISKTRPSFMSAATLAIGGVPIGFTNKKSDANAAAGEVASGAVDTLDGYKSSFGTAGENVISGFIQGFKNKVQNAVTAASNFASSVVTTVKSIFKIKSPSRVFRDEIGKMLGLGFVEGVEGTEDVAVGSISDLFTKVTTVGSDAIDKLRTYLSERMDLGDLTTAQEVEAWEAATLVYAEGTDERLAVDKEYAEAKEKLAEEEYQTYIDWIEEKREANELSLIDELAAYKRAQAAFMEGTEQRKKAEEEILRIQNEINDANQNYYDSVKQTEEDAAQRRIELEEEYYAKCEDVNERLEQDIQDLEDAYEDAIESRADKLYDAYSLFDKADVIEAADGDTLTSNLQSQIDALEKYNTAINGLSSRNVDSGLIEELQEMGPSATAQIMALNAMSDEELSAYVALWQQKHQMAKEQATLEMAGLRTETDEQIAALREEADVELDEYRAMWDEQLTALNTETEQKLEELKTDWMTKIGTLTTETENEFAQMTSNIITIVGDKSKWSESGANIIEGMLEGVISEKQRLLNELQEVMDEALAVANGELDINSPSGEFMKIGKWSILGLVKGLELYSNLSNEASADVANDAVNSMKNTIARIAETIEGDINTQPTIRPVLDLSDVEFGANKLNALFSKSQAVSINSSIKRKAEAETQNGESVPTNPTSINFTQNNYSPKALSRTEIYRQTKNQFSTMKGLVKK